MKNFLGLAYHIFGAKTAVAGLALERVGCNPTLSLHVFAGQYACGKGTHDRPRGRAVIIAGIDAVFDPAYVVERISGLC